MSDHLPYLPIICCCFDKMVYDRIEKDCVQEIALIRSIFQAPEVRQGIRLIVLEKASRADIQAALDEHYNHIQIFHYVGTEDTFQYLIDDINLPGRIPNLRLFFYNYCESTEEARLLIDRGIRTVIACPNTVTNKAALSFTEQFYRHLLAQASIGDAFEQAKRSAPQEDQDQKDENNASSDYRVTYENARRVQYRDEVDDGIPQPPR